MSLPKIVIALTAVSFVASGVLAPQGIPAPAEPPKAAQEAPTFSEKAGKVIDELSGMPVGQADTDMRRVIGALGTLAPKPLDQITAQEARKQPTPADAVKSLLRAEGKNPSAVSDALGVKTADITYESAGATLPVRIYTPPQSTGNTGPLPVVVYYHGGGWVIADIGVYDATPRAMAKLTNAIFVSVEYRRAPENKFPAAHEDAIAAYKWVLENASKFGGDPAKIAVMGESAGGNLAINVAIAARDQKLQAPVAEVLVYPVAGTDMNTESYKANAFARPLNKAMMKWFFDQTMADPKDREDPRLNLIGNADLAGLPGATVITAEIDPLMTDGKVLADRLSAAGVKVKYQNFEGVTHEFFGMAAVVAKAASAQTLAAQQLTGAFGAPASVAVR